MSKMRSHKRKTHKINQRGGGSWWEYLFGPKQQVVPEPAPAQQSSFFGAPPAPAQQSSFFGGPAKAGRKSRKSKK